jgi:hypothetical protein
MGRGFLANGRVLTGHAGLPGFLSPNAAGLPGGADGFGASACGFAAASSDLPHSAQKDAALPVREAPQ